MKNKIDEILAEVNLPAGKARALQEIHRHGGAVYGSDQGNPEVIVERHADGTSRRGRFIGRQFVPFDGNPIDAD